MTLMETAGEREQRISSQATRQSTYENDRGASFGGDQPTVSTRYAGDSAKFAAGDVAAFTVATIMMLGPLFATAVGWGG